jgi:hypothetical protein
MSSAKCFLVVPTGVTKEQACCDDPSHGTHTVPEYKRVDTGETKFSWPGAFGPGAVFIVQHEPGMCYSNWSNCDGKHIEVVCPDGTFWDASSRASNCTMKQDTLHRCWVLHGEAPNLTADKNGLTCKAGAGSIQTPSWHGFMRNGVLAP